MSNPIKPSVKTERFSLFILFLSFLAFYYFGFLNKVNLVVAFSRDGRLGQEISWPIFSLIWPLLTAVIYLMFLFFPYFKINKNESAILKEDWHKVKEISVASIFILQILAMLTLSGTNNLLVWSAPIFFFLLILSLLPSYLKVIKYRHKKSL